jgi:hypothetical protein
MVSKFDETLRLLKPSATVAGRRAGVCAMGPIDPDEKIISMEVWLFQEGRGAIATGRSGEDIGSDERERPPFHGEGGDKGQWMIRTGLERDSAEFSKDVKARALAVALVEHADGGREIQQWEEEVTLDPDHVRPPHA